MDAEQQELTYRRDLKESKEYMALEYKSMKNQLNQIRNGQIQILTASISVSAILWGLIYTISNKTPGIFSSILFLIPLSIIIPSALIFFDKSVTSAKITGFLRQIEKVNLGFTGIKYYIGYENSKKYMDSKNLNCLKNKNEITIDLDIEKNCNTDKKLKELLFHMLFCRNNRFLCVGFISFICLIAISIILSFYSAYCNCQFLPNFVSFFLLLAYLLIFSYYTFYFLEGRLHDSNAEKWHKKGKMLPYALLVIFFSPIVIDLISFFYLRHHFIELINYREYFHYMYIVIYSISVLIAASSYSLKRQERKKRKDTLDVLESKLHGFIEPEQGFFLYRFEYFSYSLGYATIVLLTLIIGVGIIAQNPYTRIIYGLAYVLLYSLILLLINFKDISYGAESVDIYEKYWNKIFEKINEYYCKFDEIEEFESKLDKNAKICK